MAELIVQELSQEFKSAPCEAINRAYGYIVGTARSITHWCGVLYVGADDGTEVKMLR